MANQEEANTNQQDSSNLAPSQEVQAMSDEQLADTPSLSSTDSSRECDGDGESQAPAEAPVAAPPSASLGTEVADTNKWWIGANRNDNDKNYPVGAMEGGGDDNSSSTADLTTGDLLAAGLTPRELLAAVDGTDQFGGIQPMPSPSLSNSNHSRGRRRISSSPCRKASSKISTGNSHEHETPGAYAVRTIRHDFGRGRNTSSRPATTPEQSSTTTTPEQPSSTCPSVADVEEEQGEQDNDGDLELVVANPVGTESTQSNLELPHAEALEPKEEEPENLFVFRRNMMIIGVGLVAVLVLIISLLAAGITNQKEEKENLTVPPTVQPSFTPSTLSLEQSIMTFLPNYTQRAILDPDTPQAKAYQWLLNDPHLPLYPEWRVKQRLALAILYYATDGSEWDNSTNWLSYEHHECTWYSSTIADRVLDEAYLDYSVEVWMKDIKENGGYACGREFNATTNDSETGHYTRLCLINNNLHGPIPEELYWLTSLESATFITNPMVGTISSQMGILSNLQSLNLVSLELEGSLPTEIGLLSKLTALILYTNSLSGSLPTEIGALHELQELYLEENSFTGTLPTEIGLLGKAFFMFLDTNGFSGTLPTELGLLSSMEDFQIWGTAISGSIPSALGQMTSLTTLDIAEIALTGPVPTELSVLPRLSKLALFDNLLTGTIPKELFSLPNLTKVMLQHNQLTGEIATEIGQCSQLTWLSVGNNQLQGSFPIALSSLTHLETLGLDQNSFTGSIPSEVGLFTNISAFRVDSNSISGSIPSELGHWSQLTELNLSDNNLQGSIPDAVANLIHTGQLMLLNISGNPQLSGTLPEELCVVPEEVNIIYDCTEHLCGCKCNCDSTNATNKTEHHL